MQANTRARCWDPQNWGPLHLEHIEFPAKLRLLDYFLRISKSNINQLNPDTGGERSEDEEFCNAAGNGVASYTFLYIRVTLKLDRNGQYCHFPPHSNPYLCSYQPY